MSFHWPIAFWFLLVPLALAALELRRRRANGTDLHPKILRAEAGPHQLSLATDSGAAKPSLRIRWRLWLGLAFAVIAFARPQWGRLEEPSFDQSREILIALDLSRSMLSDDVRPSRLERAKLLVNSLLERLNGERVGLVVFSGTAFLQSPLSADYEILREFLPDLNTRFLPEGGTDYNALLKTTLTAFGATDSADRYLIILSDGEATDDDWKPLAADLKAKGIRVIGLGIGTSAGAMIPDGSGGFVKDDRGAVVLSKLESSTLQQLASETDGVYADASAWVDLAQLIQSTVETGRKGSFVERSRVRLAERFQWALAPAVLLLLWSFWREVPVRPRLRDVKFATPPTSPPPLPVQPQPASTTSTVVASVVVLLLLGLITPPARAEEKETPPAEQLGKLVANYAQRDDLTAHDYAEFARTTLTYGQRLQSTKKDVPAGPVHDGLAAVEAGRRLDAKAADWPTLQRDLEALLKKKEEPPPKEQPKQQPEQKKPDQQKDQQKDQPKDKQQQPQNQQEKQPPEKPEDQKSDQTQKPPPPKEQSAFGDMKDRSAEKSDQPPPPADPTEQQKVGGTPEKKPGEESKDPALAVPLQKLDQLKNQDSPVQLYQLMQGNKPTPKKTGKDW
jgi:Ca-activated chloride channel family protein